VSIVGLLSFIPTQEYAPISLVFSPGVSALLVVGRERYNTTVAQAVRIAAISECLADLKLSRGEFVPGTLSP
jgi:hypothetical protein